MQPNPKRILIINAHPRPGSFTDAIVQAYAEGAECRNHDTTIVTLRELRFDPNLKSGYRDNVLEPDLVAGQQYIKDCTHLVIVTPVWWLGLPALLKGYFDRILTPGFAYKYEKSILPFPKRLLKGRSARVIYTQGGPKYLTFTLGFDSFWKALKYGTLIFSGFGPVRRTYMGNVPKSTLEQRTNFLRKVRRLGEMAR